LLEIGHIAVLHVVEAHLALVRSVKGLGGAFPFVDILYYSSEWVTSWGIPESAAVGLVLPSCNSEAKALHLGRNLACVAPGAHALVLLDQAGWHVSKKLSVPGNITLVRLPPKSPELNPVENI
jgi:hypothetical protein